MIKVLETVDPAEWSAVIRCGYCDSKLEFNGNDVRHEEFKGDPHTYWFDGSARTCDGYSIACPRCKNTIILDIVGGTWEDLPLVEVPLLVQHLAKEKRKHV